MKQHKWKQQFFSIALGQTFSLIGSSAVQFALIWWIASETESPMMLGIAGAVAYLPMLFLSPLAGVLADKVNRKLICICADLFIGLCAVVFAIVMWVHEIPCEGAILVLLLRGIGNTFHQPSIQAIIPQLVPQEELTRANGWSQFMQSGAFMIGPVLGAALYAAFPMPVLLLTDMAGAILASVLLGIVKIPAVDTSHQKKQGFFREFREGIQVYREDRKLLTLLIAETACMIFFLPLATFYPLMTSSYFNASAWHGSAVELAYSVGMMLVAILFGSVVKVKNKLWVSYLGLLGVGVTTTIGGVLPPYMWAWWIFLFGCGLMGGFANVHGIPLVAYMQETIAPEKMGRAFSLMAMVGSVTLPIGLLIGSPVAEKIGVHVWFLIAGISVTVITLAALLIERKIKPRELSPEPPAAAEGADT